MHTSLNHTKQTSDLGQDRHRALSDLSAHHCVRRKERFTASQRAIRPNNLEDRAQQHLLITNAVLVEHGVDRYPARFKFAAFATQGLLNHVVAERMNDRAEFVLTHSKLFDNGLPINQIEFRVIDRAVCQRFRAYKAGLRLRVVGELLAHGLLGLVPVDPLLEGMRQMLRAEKHRKRRMTKNTHCLILLCHIPLPNDAGGVRPSFS